MSSLPGLDKLFEEENFLIRHQAPEAAKYKKEIATFVGLDEASIESDLRQLCNNLVYPFIYYGDRLKYANRKLWGYIIANSLLVLAIPIFLALLPILIAKFTSKLDLSSTSAIVGMVTSDTVGALTGILALQKSISAWYAQQQRFAAWNKAASDLRVVYNKLIHDVGSESPLIALRDATASARSVVSAERDDYYQRLALPSMDVLDMLTASRSAVVGLVTSMVPGAPAIKALAIGAKVFPGEAQPSAPSPPPPAQVTLSDTTVDTAKLLSKAVFQAAVDKITDDDIDQKTADACAALSFANSSDIAALFSEVGGFIAWFNKRLGPLDAFTQALRSKIDDGQDTQDHFDNFWNNIPAVFGKDTINAIEFTALMCIALKEVSGDLVGKREKGGSKAYPEYPGLAYFFSKLAKVPKTPNRPSFPGKASYNHVNGNISALKLFTDTDYNNQNGALAGYDSVHHNGQNPDQAWDSYEWPAHFDPSEDAGKNAYIMQADFFKFRGRGVIQLTGRDWYLKVIKALMVGDTSNDMNLDGIKKAWGQRANGIDPILIATISTEDEWNTAFSTSMGIALGIRVHDEANNKYLAVSTQATTLNGSGSGSLYYVGLKINGADYANSVQPMMKTMLNGIALDVAKNPPLVA